MRHLPADPHGNPGASLPALPLDADHWQALVDALKLSPRQAEIAALMIRGAQLKEIAAVLGIEVCTIRSQQERIYRKVGIQSHEFFACILGASHRVGRCTCGHK